MQDYVSSYIDKGFFGTGNCSWARNPDADPMAAEAKARGLKWGHFDKPGLYRIHYMHCGGVWVDRVRLEWATCSGPGLPDTQRLRPVGVGGWADQFDAEWMPIPDDFPMPVPKAKA